jgi:hypothetical protein
MAAVAGAIAAVGQALRTYSRTVIVENGETSSSMRSRRYGGSLCRSVSLWRPALPAVGPRRCVGSVLLRAQWPFAQPGGGRRGLLKAASAALADAVATAQGNRVKGAADIPSA